MKRLLLVLLVLAPVLGPLASTSAKAQAPAGVWTVDTLLAGFATMPGLQAEFREEKHMDLLAAPLVNEGTLHFAKGKLARHTTKPVASSVLIANGLLEFGDAEGKQSIDLQSNPVVKLFVDSFVHIFAGDKAALEQLYAISFGPTKDGSWTMSLAPRMSPMNGVIDRVVLEGKDLVVTKMTIVEKGGDETITTFTKVDTARRYTSLEMTEVFTVR